MPKVTKVFHLSLVQENQAFNSNNLVYRIILATEVDKNYFKKAEEKRNLLNLDTMDYYFLNLNPRYPFYDSYDTFVTNTNLYITNKLNITHLTQGYANELPLLITKFATDFKNRAVIEIEMEERTDQEYKFDFKNLYFKIAINDVDSKISEEFFKQVRGLYYGTIKTCV